MSVTEVVQRLKKSVAQRGLGATLSRFATRLYRRAAPVGIPVHPFDLKYGVDTSGLIGGKLLGAGHAHDAHITAYWGIAPSLLHDALAHWEATLAGTGFPVHDYTFIDIGCGKGRALLLASAYPFRRIVGVELNGALVAIARANLARWKICTHGTPPACPEIAVEEADALDLALPDGAMLVYLFNPFDAPVLELLLARLHALADSRSAPVDLLYARPEHHALIEALPSMQLLHIGEVPFTAEETAADAFQTRSLDYRLYRFAPGRDVASGADQPG